MALVYSSSDGVAELKGAVEVVLEEAAAPAAAVGTSAHF